MEKIDSSKWSNTDCQYMEVSDFGLLQDMLHERFVNMITGEELEHQLELRSLKAPPQRPLGSKNKIKVIERIDISALLEKETIG